MEIKSLLREKRKEIIVIAVAILFTTASWIYYISQIPTINVTDYLVIETWGYDTDGNLKVYIDEEKMMDEIVDIYDKDSYRNDANNLYDMMYSIAINYDKRENLSNGDKVKVTLYLDENLGNDLGIQFKIKEKVIEIQDLVEAEMINPFDYIELSFEGESPNAKAVVNYNDKELELVKSVAISVSPSNGLSEGDQVEVVFTGHDPDEAIKDGYIFEETNRVYTFE